MRFLFCCFVLVALTGCEILMSPSPMPAGYTYHNDAYKSPPGPDAKDIGYDYSYAQNEMVQQEWVVAARDLVVHMEQETGLLPQKIYVKDVLFASGFNQAFDHALRRALRERGYVLASGADSFPARLTYEAVPVEKMPVVRVPLVQNYQERAAYVLKVSLYRGTPDPEVIEKVYDVPAYGYSQAAHIEEEKVFTDTTRTQNFEPLGGENN